MGKGGNHVPSFDDGSYEAHLNDTKPVAIPASLKTGKPWKEQVDLKKYSPCPIFSTNEVDRYDHQVRLYHKHSSCRGQPMAWIQGLPSAYKESVYRKGFAQGGGAPGAQGDWGKPDQVEGNVMWHPVDDDGYGNLRPDWSPSVLSNATRGMKLKAGMVGHAYGNKMVPGSGVSSKCIEIDLFGVSAHYLLLWRSSAQVPRTMAALWHGEGCYGEPDMWAIQGLGETESCIKGVGREKGGTWRSMRIWTGSERLDDARFADGTISLMDEFKVWTNDCCGQPVYSEKVAEEEKEGAKTW